MSSLEVVGLKFSKLCYWDHCFVLIGRKKFSIAKPNKTDLVLLKDLLAAGKVESVIDRLYPLSDVAEALRYLEEGHAQGKVVITVEHSND